jgi:membrane-bound lytic murein transglycosylase D
MMNATLLRRIAMPFVLIVAGCASLPDTGGSALPPSAAVIIPPPAPPIDVVADEPAALKPLVAPLLAEAAGPAARRDPLRAMAGFEPEDPSVRNDLWERVRKGFTMPPLQGPLVRKWEQWYASRPDYVQRMTERGSRYLFHIVEEVDRRGLPTELALLPFIESAFNPQAMSSAKASGMWQFMPATGRDFELRQNLFRDDRRDVLASTRAALDYLEKLHAIFGDWHLALAAYNWGQGNVMRAVEQNKRARRGIGYEDLRMPAETRNYVPKLHAVKNIVLGPQAVGLQLPPLENHPFFLGVAIERDIDVALAARLAGMPLDDFQALNPQMNKPVILAAGTPQLLLPYDNANRFLRELRHHQGPLATWTAWVAPQTMKPAAAAKAAGVSEAQLLEVNQIPARMLVRAGSTLLVPRGAHSTSDVAGAIADSAVLALAPESRQRAAKGKPAKGGAAVKTASVDPGRAVAKIGPKAGTRTTPKAQRPVTRTRVAQATTPSPR